RQPRPHRARPAGDAPHRGARRRGSPGGRRGARRVTDFDVLVVGSGFGGSVAALRAAEKGYRVGVLEAGRRVGRDDLPRTNWHAELAPYFEVGRRMLGAVEVPFTTPADEVMREVAERMGAGETFRRTHVAVHFGPAGPDPYFGGAGPARGTCVRNGGCMVGCRFDAKNTLDRNYLYLAERAGAVVLPEREAVRVVPVDVGFKVEAERPGAW